MADSADSHANPPAIVIYIVDAFLGPSGMRNEGGDEEEGEEVESGCIWLLGLLRCYTEMLQTLPAAMRPALVLQVKNTSIYTKSDTIKQNSVAIIFFQLLSVF